MRCLIYARVSSEDQVEKYGIPVQLRACHEHARRNGYEVVQEISDEGISGTTLDRPGLHRARAMVREGAVDVVLAFDVDRISRELAHLLLLKPEIERNARLEFVSAQFEDTPSGRMFFGMRGVIGQFEREQFLERTLRGRKEKARSGYIVGGRVPFGYSYRGLADGERGRYVIHPEQAEVARQIFAWADSGLSIREIARRLNDAGVRPQASERWGKSSVARILRSEIYAGVAHYNRRKRSGTVLRMRPESDWIQLAVPAIVDRPLWNRVAARLDQNRIALVGRPTRHYLLRGLLYCACGARMVGEPGRGRPAYRCSRRCGRPQVNAAKLDACVWDAVSRPFRDPQTLRRLLRRYRESLESPEARDRAAKLTEDLERTKSRETRAVRALLDMPDYDEIKDQLIEIRAWRRRLEAEIERLSVQAPEVPLDELVPWIEDDLCAMSDDARQEFLRACVERIDLDGADIRITCFLSVKNRPQRVDDWPTGIREDHAGKAAGRHPASAGV